jgi:hypothetical protein
MDTTICEWCNQPVSPREANADGNHKDIFGCRSALIRKVKKLSSDNALLVEELQAERSLTSSLLAKLG